MKRVLIGLALGALIFGVSFAGARLATVTNPMTADVNGNGYSILNLARLQVGVVGQFGSNDPAQPIRGTITMGDGTAGEGVEIVAGHEDPAAAAFHLPPGTIYLRHAADERGELWLQECVDAAPCWMKVAG